MNASGWQRDPFGGELVDGIVWGRGAIDMLNLTRRWRWPCGGWPKSGWKPRGTLIYLAVADEEARRHSWAPGTWSSTTPTR